MLWCKNVSPEAILFTPMQYILIFATVMKGITPTTFNHVIYNISDFIHLKTKKNVLGLCPRTFYSSLENVKSQKRYTLYLVKVDCGGSVINGATPSSFSTSTHSSP